MADLSALLTPGGLMESGEDRILLKPAALTFYLSLFISNVLCLDPESSAELKEERVANTRETVSSSHNREKAKQAGREDHSVLHVTSAADNRKPKSAQELVDGNAVPIGELDTSRRKRKPLHDKVFAYLYIYMQNPLLSYLVVFCLKLILLCVICGWLSTMQL